MGEYSQWHYLAGYLIVLSSHNWPIMLCAALGLYHAVRLYRHPCLAEVRRLYGWALLGLAYEYHKHLRGVADEAVDFLLVWKFWRWNRWGHDLTATFTPLVVALAAWMFWTGLRVHIGLPGRRAGQPSRSLAPRLRSGGVRTSRPGDRAAGDRR